MLVWGSTFTQKVGVNRGSSLGGVWFVKMAWGVGGWCVICIGWGVENGVVVVCEKEMDVVNYEVQ